MALAATIATAVVRPRRLPEAAVAVPLAGLLIALQVVRPRAAWEEISTLGPTVGFLAAILLLAHLCDEEGVFTAAGNLMARRPPAARSGCSAWSSRSPPWSPRCSHLDATVVLLTPAVFATAVTMRARPRPHVYACTHLANSASLLLPVSNLTNLLAFAATGLSFVRFAGLMVGAVARRHRDRVRRVPAVLPRRPRRPGARRNRCRRARCRCSPVSSRR